MLAGMGLLIVAMQGQAQQQKPGPASGENAALHPAFESLLRGAAGVRRNELDRGQQRLFDRIAKRLGVTNGPITRAQLYQLSNAPQQSGASGEMLTGPTNNYRSTSLVDRAGSQLETKAPLIYRSDNLPRELPAWFRTVDTNQDAQISLYEWRMSGRSIAEFQRMDRNGDGFLTVEEVLYFLRQRGDLTAGNGPDTRRVDHSRR
jgi:hypothetical protein